MDLYTLILVHISTFMISLVGFYLFFKLFKRYRENTLLPTLFLALYALFLAIEYVFTLLLRFPTEEVNIAHTTMLIPLVVFVTNLSAPFFSASFAALTLAPKYGKYLTVVPLILTICSLTLIFIYPPVWQTAKGGIVELVVHENAITAIWITIIVSFIAPIYLIFYTIIVKGRENKLKGFLITVSLFVLAYLVCYQENFGAGAAIYLRRIFILIAMSVLYLGFTMPKWLALKRD